MDDVIIKELHVLWNKKILVNGSVLPAEAITHQFISITAVTTNFIFLIDIYVSIFKDNPWFEKNNYR